jgi:hypothetical protein
MKFRNIAAFFFLATMLCSVSAYTVSSIEISPAGDLPSGIPVTANWVIEFPVTGSETFPEYDELQISSGLVRPEWDWTLILDGNETPQPKSSGRVLSLSGWILSYPSEKLHNESIQFTLTGTTPVLNSTENITVFCVSQYATRSSWNVPCDYEKQITVIASPAPAPAVLNTTIPRPTIAAQQQSLLDRIFSSVKNFFGLR